MLLIIYSGSLRFSGNKCLTRGCSVAAVADMLATVRGPEPVGAGIAAKVTGAASAGSRTRSRAGSRRTGTSVAGVISVRPAGAGCFANLEIGHSAVSRIAGDESRVCSAIRVAIGAKCCCVVPGNFVRAAGVAYSISGCSTNATFLGSYNNRLVFFGIKHITNAYLVEVLVGSDRCGFSKDIVACQSSPSGTLNSVAGTTHGTINIRVDFGANCCVQ